MKDEIPGRRVNLSFLVLSLSADRYSIDRWAQRSGRHQSGPRVAGGRPESAQMKEVAEGSSG